MMNANLHLGAKSHHFMSLRELQLAAAGRTDSLMAAQLVQVDVNGNSSIRILETCATLCRGFFISENMKLLFSTCCFAQARLCSKNTESVRKDVRTAF